MSRHMSVGSRHMSVGHGTVIAATVATEDFQSRVNELAFSLEEERLSDVSALQGVFQESGLQVGFDVFKSALTQVKFDSMLSKLERDEVVHPVDLERERDLPKYKNHSLKGCLLHYAVWLSNENSEVDAETVRLVLRARASVDSTCYYLRPKSKGKNKEELVQLQAVHIAAGWGCVPALRALAESVASQDQRRDLLNRYCKKEGADYYVALHDAAFCGQKETVVWLLENKADPRKRNIDGFSALHWLAYKGLSQESDLEAVVRALVKYNARLDEKTSDRDNQLGIEGIPMEIAALPTSNFPNHLMHLLAPSVQAFGLSSTVEAGPASSYKDTRSVFEDLVLLCGRNMQAASEFAREIVASGGAELRNKVMMDAQRPDAVPRMAQVFQVAPQAAAHILGCLVVAPRVQDSGHHPISTRATLRKWLCDHPMLCEYQTDTADREVSKPMWPIWTCTNGGSVYPAWHDGLMRKGGEASDVEVVTRVVMMPNILDVDLFMAFADMRPAHIQTFSHVAIQGTIYCMWQKLIMPAYCLLIALNLVDMLVIFSWGWASDNSTVTSVTLSLDYIGASQGSGTNSPIDRPLCWTILLAAVLRDLCNIVWAFGQHCRKWREYGGDLTKVTENAGLLDLWHPVRFLRPQLAMELGFCGLEVWFLCGTGGLQPGAVLSDTQQALLASLFLLQCARVLHMARVIQGAGRRILSIMRTVIGAAMLEMVAVMVMTFLAIAAALVMVQRQESVLWVATYAFVGLNFGDGQSLAEFGLDPTVQPNLPAIEPFIAFLGSIAFNIVLLNLLIAIFANEYDKVEKVAEFHFQRERSRICCWCLLALQKLRRTEDLTVPLRRRSVLWKVLGCLAFVCVPVTQVAGAYTPPQGDKVFYFVSATFLAIAEVVLLAVMMESPWFLQRADGKVGPPGQNFLWICHKADLEDCIDPSATPAPSVGVAAAGAPIGALSGEAHSNAFAALEAKVARLAQQVEEIAAGRTAADRQHVRARTALNAKLDAILGYVRPAPNEAVRGSGSFGNDAAPLPAMRRQTHTVVHRASQAFKEGRLRHSVAGSDLEAMAAAAAATLGQPSPAQRSPPSPTPSDPATPRKQTAVYVAAATAAAEFASSGARLLTGKKVKKKATGRQGVMLGTGPLLERISEPSEAEEVTAHTSAI